MHVYYPNNLAEGLSETRNGTVFACSQGMGPVTGTFQAQLCYVDFSAAELETCKLGPPASAAAA
jgi:hypothetical protein